MTEAGFLGLAVPMLPWPPGRPASPPSLSPSSRVFLVPLLAQGSLQSLGAARGEERPVPRAQPSRHPPAPTSAGAGREDGGGGGGGAVGSGRRQLSLTHSHSRGRNADGRAALWSRLRPTNGGRRPGTQPVGLGSPPSC